MSTEIIQEFSCPCCGRPNSHIIELTVAGHQTAVTDCEVCCRPILIEWRLADGELSYFHARAENE